ncbi:hypothetical protein GGX14DRAFT_659638 [Mycena pura]|uniref:F-box domain-containing protein n=1 Tax=Mycena pura TaxID=153505 RepID=A0AAD6V2N0_9AGAR|nr:hypothetical protein GGX14DRAFT_659638 [Mycena pura]
MAASFSSHYHHRIATFPTMRYPITTLLFFAAAAAAAAIPAPAPGPLGGRSWPMLSFRALKLSEDTAAAATTDPRSEHWHLERNKLEVPPVAAGGVLDLGPKVKGMWELSSKAKAKTPSKAKAKTMSKAPEDDVLANGDLGPEIKTMRVQNRRRTPSLKAPSARPTVVANTEPWAATHGTLEKKPEVEKLRVQPAGPVLDNLLQKCAHGTETTRRLHDLLALAAAPRVLVPALVARPVRAQLCQRLRHVALALARHVLEHERMRRLLRAALRVLAAADPEMPQARGSGEGRPGRMKREVEQSKERDVKDDAVLYNPAAVILGRQVGHASSCRTRQPCAGESSGRERGGARGSMDSESQDRWHVQRSGSPFPLSFTILMPSKRLPVQELCDAIVDLLRYDEHILHHMACASSSFAPRAQSHLFRKLGILPFTGIYGEGKSVAITQRLVNTMKSSPHLVPMVEILSFEFAEPPALDLLASIPWQRVHQLHLPVESRGSGFNPEGVQTLISLPSVRHVQLAYRGSQYWHRHELFGLLSHLNPGVEVLELKHIEVKYSPSHPSYNNIIPEARDDPIPPPPHSRAVVPRLRRLILSQSAGDYLCEPACPLDLSVLHELEAYWIDDADVLLSTLTVGEVANLDRFSINLLHNITDIHCNSFGKYSHLHRLFDHVAPDNHIANIYITTLSDRIERNEKPYQHDNFVVVAGDLETAVLARLPVLQKVSIKVKIYHIFFDQKRQGLQTKAEDAFSRLVKQNMLEVSFEAVY